MENNLKNNIYVYNLITAVHLKLTHFKLTILQFKKRKNALKKKELYFCLINQSQ